MTARPAGLVQVDDSCTEATIEIQGAYGNVVHARLRVLVALHAMVYLCDAHEVMM